MTNQRSNLYDSILKQVRKAMEDQKITQSDLGNALSLKQSAVSSLLSGKSRLTIDQYLVVSGLLGIKPHKFFSAAEAEITKNVPMPPEVESVLYKSEIHLIAYCAATRDVTIDELITMDYPQEKIRAALDELVKIGVLTKKREKYSQTQPNIIYTPSSRVRSTECHRKIALNAWRTWERLRLTSPVFKGKTFNFVLLDRFTRPQMKEVESLLWQAYEKVQTFQQLNMANGYHSDEPMPLYNLHMMITLPLES